LVAAPFLQGGQAAYARSVPIATVNPAQYPARFNETIPGLADCAVASDTLDAEIMRVEGDFP